MITKEELVAIWPVDWRTYSSTCSRSLTACVCGTEVAVAVDTGEVFVGLSSTPMPGDQLYARLIAARNKVVASLQNIPEVHTPPTLLRRVLEVLREHGWAGCSALDKQWLVWDRNGVRLELRVTDTDVTLYVEGTPRRKAVLNNMCTHEMLCSELSALLQFPRF